MRILTLQQLKNLPPNTPIAHGYISQNGEAYYWAAVRGGYHDWAAYRIREKAVAPMVPTVDEILAQGDKLYAAEAVRLVNADEEAAEMYRS